MLDYKLVEALAMVVRENGFDRAAQKLHITQSAVSQRIKALEDQSGQVLLARTTPPKATIAGQRIIKHYLQVKRLEDDLEQSFKLGEQQSFTELILGINDDSLATWFLPAVSDFVLKESVLLDLRKDDQEKTQQMLKDGNVVGCISGSEHPIKGCRVTYLGDMIYHMVAAKPFVDYWFADGVTVKAFEEAPLVIFNRNDRLHQRYFHNVLKAIPTHASIHYLPSTERFVDFIVEGLAYGLLIDHQCKPLLETRKLVELIPNTPVSVSLYWHCWNLKSPLLTRFSNQLVRNAGKLLTYRNSERIRS